MPPIQNPSSSRSISRTDFINLLNTALNAGEHRFARRAALQWLSQFPGDLEVSLLQTKAFHAGGGSPRTILGHLQQLILKDPYFVAAYRFGWELWVLSGESAGKRFANGLHAIGEQMPIEGIAQWSQELRQVFENLRVGALDEAEAALLRVIADDPPTPLVAGAHIELLQRQNGPPDTPSSLIRLKILQHYAHRWETCIPIRLSLAEALLYGPDPDLGVSYLHDAMAEDIAGQVVTRMFGHTHPFTEMWPRQISGKLDLALPASISSILGWNLIEDRLAVSSATHPPENTTACRTGLAQQTTDSATPGNIVEKTDSLRTSHSVHAGVVSKSTRMPETLLATQTTLEKIARKIQQPELMQSEGRYPVYVILSSKTALRKKYGAQGSARIIQSMQQLQWAVGQRKGWNSHILFVDDPQTTTPLAVKPVIGEDAWAIKNQLRDIDRQLAARGEMIGALLIVGGADIVPFHRLPNPVEDLDVDVPSDNPYATVDDNYFVPEWPVGRLPGDASGNPDLLIRALNRIVNLHAHGELKTGWFTRIIRRLQSWFRRTKMNDNYGYTAAIWSRASAAVFQPLGNPHQLLVSPPDSYQEFKRSEISGALGYFNLHGIQDSSDWYGHNDPSHPADGPDYPVALRPVDIQRSSRIPAVIFTEACFGADIDGKQENNSITLRFLSQGADCIVGSTSTAYGAVTTPLIAADYLANSFWKHLRQGTPVGEAHKRAKIDLIQEMDRRQGYLDGEDQKTLISFVLYGDPLYRYQQTRPTSKEVIRPTAKPEVIPLEEVEQSEADQPISPETVYTIKQFVREYLPGLENGSLTVHALRNNAQSESTTQRSTHQKSAAAHLNFNRQVVTISKSFQRRRKTHHQFARLTLDCDGKLLKISVSR